MAIKPILFSTPMVQALLDGRKTQTRRMHGLEVINKNPSDYQFEWADYRLKKPFRFTQISSVNKKSLKNRDFVQEECAPKYSIDDVLWVRETFGSWNNEFQYKASTRLGEDVCKWKPNIHMPKVVCRIFLRVTSVKVQRLNQITEADAISEGLKKAPNGMYYRYDIGTYTQSPLLAFVSLWESIHGRLSWDVNPWVWVYEFERCEMPDNFLTK